MYDLWDEEKAAALDRAIEFEDAWRPPAKECIMIDRTLLTELDAAAGEIRAAEDRFIAICRKIAGKDEGGRQEPTVAAIGVVGGNPGTAPTGKAATGRGHRPPDPEDIGPSKKEYWFKVHCAVCKESKGSRIYEGVRYPVLHKNPDTGENCKGSFKAGVEFE